MRLLVLNVDRDDDLGRKTGIKGPILGRQEMLTAAAALALADPEEADANGMFAAVKEYDEIVLRKLEYDAEEVFVGAVTGHIREGLFADNAIAQQFDALMGQTKCDAVILVSDGGEDEHVLPILKTRVKVNGIRRVIIKQAKNLEGFLALFNRLLHDEKLQKRFFLPMALLFIAAGAAVLFRKPELFIASGLFLAAVYIMVHVFSLQRPLGGLFHGVADGLRGGRMSLFASIGAFFLVVGGGFLALRDVEGAAELGTVRYSVEFGQAMFPWIVGAVVLVIIGRGLDSSARPSRVPGGNWELLLLFLATATAIYGFLTVLEGLTRPAPLTVRQSVNLEFLTTMFFAGFLFFSALIARHYFAQVSRSPNYGSK